MYHLLKGLHAHLTRKDEYSVVIIGLDNVSVLILNSFFQGTSADEPCASGGEDGELKNGPITTVAAELCSLKTMLERIKTMYNATPGMPPDKIGPTVGQNIGKISLPSTTLSFFDLGGQRDIRSIWPRYYDECHAVAFVLDACDQARLNETWEVFDEVLNSPRLLNLPLLLLANKQDAPTCLSVQEIRESFDAWHRARTDDDLDATEEGSPSRDEMSGTADPESQDKKRRAAERMASLDVMGVSALEGDGVREAVNWLYIRVQNARPLGD
ncbi:P-loop containing nucleoside triphosphate hydrolase protein [Kockovaella imperatae]|uniref:p-loop containing nucleoside triphosphate hydrolase protein n=1 Tax=Kockovaella imperatae TaxID=4999 RepID=A0A1Y1UEN4_9TREE|nr:P-loop containing nucleoside triphosphate hydrolase protein [Kockovaella imperatae]ORX36482.1 P-loop containing nucleoside triphosphate hydrolase protein [Kockovaella imperatae]